MVGDGRRRRFTNGRLWLVRVLMLALMLVASACSSSEVGNVEDSVAGPTATESVPTEVPTVEARTEVPSVEAQPDPTPTSVLTMGQGDPVAAADIAPAPLGSFVVAREGAGIPRTNRDGETQLEIPVYDVPFGPPRVLLDVNRLDDRQLPIRLTNWSNAEGARVMRLIAGTASDDWLMVQAPSRPHDRYVWVRRADFDFGSTSMQIEIDLAPGGGLTLYDGGEVLLTSGIVHGRESRETPTHLTYIEGGIRGASVSPAYGTAILSMASFSEVLGTFGGGLPSNYLHGTNQPDLMGQRVSSGEIRVPNEVLDEIIETITPGTPVLMFNSSVAVDNKEAILDRPIAPATTADFLTGLEPAVNGTSFVTPQLWRRCGDIEGSLLCRMGVDGAVAGRYPYLVAIDEAGEVNPDLGTNVVPVFDMPDGEARMLVHEAPDVYEEWRYPLRSPGFIGAPLVLWPLERSPDGDWYRVQAPVLPQRQSVWVRAGDFELRWTDYRIEIDIAGEGNLTLFDGDTEIISTAIVSGRETRPTPLGATYIDGVFEGEPLTPAYGPYVLSMPIYNEVLTTFGGALAKQLVHGTNQPELMGQRVASGHVRVPNEVLTFMAEQPGGLVGARVVTVDSTSSDRDTMIEQEQQRPWTPARTTDPTDTSLRYAPPGF